MAEGKVAASRSALQRLEATNVNEFPEGLVTENISQLESKVLQLDQDLTNLRATFGENWPAVIEKRSEIVLVKDQLTREKSVALARSREQARLDVTAAEATLGMTAQSLTEQKGLVNRFHEASIRYNILKREVDTNRNLYDGLLERLRQNGVMAGFQFGNIQILESGRPLRTPDSPKVMWILAIASLLGLALGVCVAILLDFWDNSISTLEEAEQLASLPSLGSVPLIKAPKTRLTGKQNGNGRLAEPVNGNALPATQPAQPWQLTESMRAICASILLSRSDERPRLIVVTSATPAEGKTTLVTHLGKAFAEAGLTTLLVEADLRKPDLSKAFSIGNEDGLSLFLAGHVSPGPKIHETEVPNLFVAAGGPIPPNPAALLHSDRLRQFLEAVVTDYQVVLVDTPPLSMADARILGTKADGVVLVVRAGRTARNVVLRACSTLDTAGVNVLGMVLNGEEPDPTSSPYYGGYYEYSHG
jgi:capsular exopolysaccharide synthesis family protein